MGVRGRDEEGLSLSFSLNCCSFLFLFDCKIRGRIFIRREECNDLYFIIRVIWVIHNLIPFFGYMWKFLGHSFYFFPTFSFSFFSFLFLLSSFFFQEPFSSFFPFLLARRHLLPLLHHRPHLLLVFIGIIIFISPSSDR